jgi:hypothetical protein
MRRNQRGHHPRFLARKNCGLEENDVVGTDPPSSSRKQQQQQNPAWFDDFTSSQKTALQKVLSVRDSTARELELEESVVDAKKKHIIELEKQLHAAREQLSNAETNCELFRNRLKHLVNFK